MLLFSISCLCESQSYPKKRVQIHVSQCFVSEQLRFIPFSSIHPCLFVLSRLTRKCWVWSSFDQVAHILRGTAWMVSMQGGCTTPQCRFTLTLPKQPRHLLLRLHHRDADPGMQRLAVTGVQILQCIRDCRYRKVEHKAPRGTLASYQKWCSALRLEHLEIYSLFSHTGTWKGKPFIYTHAKVFCNHRPCQNKGLGLFLPQYDAIRETWLLSEVSLLMGGALPFLLHTHWYQEFLAWPQWGWMIHLLHLNWGLTCHKGMPTPGIYGWVSKQTDLNKINPSKQLVLLILNTCVLLVSPREHIVCRLMHLKKEKEQGKKNKKKSKPTIKIKKTNKKETECS